jgi:hypothetical protein
MDSFGTAVESVVGNSSPLNPDSQPRLMPSGIRAIQWVAAGLLGGWLGSDAFSFHGWVLVALVMVGTLSLREALRWWQLGRCDGAFRLRSPVAMVVSFGVVGGLLLSLLVWLIGLGFGGVLARLPRIGAEAWLRCLGGAAMVAPLFGFSWILAQRRQSSSDQEQRGSRAVPGTSLSNDRP